MVISVRPDEIFYIITRYNEKGKVVWERLSRKKQGFYSTVGSINSFYGRNSDTVTLEGVSVSGRNITLLDRYTGTGEYV
jgi:hypothetical protein